MRIVVRLPLGVRDDAKVKGAKGDGSEEHNRLLDSSSAGSDYNLAWDGLVNRINK